MMRISIRGEKQTFIYQMGKDNFETERLVIKMLLIAGNELKKEKWTYEAAKNPSNDFFSPYFYICPVPGRLYDSLLMEPHEWYVSDITEIVSVKKQQPKASWIVIVDYNCHGMNGND